MALLWKMICNLGDPMSLRHPVCLCIYFPMELCVCVYVCVHVCVCVCVRVCACVCE